MSVVTRLLLSAPSLRDDFDLVHLDTSDHRTISNQGLLDLRNVFLAIKHGISFAWRILSQRWDLIYIPIAQNRLGFLRDLLFLIPSRWSRGRRVVHLHGGYFDVFYRESRWWMKRLIHLGLNRVDIGLVLADDLRHCLAPVIAADRILTVANGVSDIVPGEPRDSNSFRVLYLGGLMKSKGVLTIVQSMPEVLSELPGAHFVFAGEWYSEEEKREAMDFIARHELHAHVAFPGRVEGVEKNRLLLRSHLLVMPTYYPFEGQPLVLIEGMAASLPIVATPLPGIRALLPDGQHAIHLPPQDPGALSRAILELAADPARRDRMGRANRVRYLEHFTEAKFLERMSKVFHRALSSDGELRAEGLRITPEG